MSYYEVISSNVTLRDDGSRRWVLVKGDVIQTVAHPYWGDLVIRIIGSLSGVEMRNIPMRLSIRSPFLDVEEQLVWSGGSRPECNTSHPDWNPEEVCFCAFHCGILKDVTRFYERDEKLGGLGL